MSRWFEEVYGSTITVSIVGNLVVLLRFRDFACVFFTFGLVQLSTKLWEIAKDNSITMQFHCTESPHYHYLFF